MSARWEYTRQRLLADPADQACYLGIDLEEGDPMCIRWNLLTLAEVQSGVWGDGADKRSEVMHKMKALLPKSGDLTLLVLLQAVKLLGLRLRVVTHAEAGDSKKARSQGKTGKLPDNALMDLSPEELLFDRGLYKQDVAVAYLTSCLRQENEHQIQLGLRNAIECRRGRMSSLSKKLGMQPEAVFEMMTGTGCPKVTSFLQIIKGMNFELLVEVAPQEQKSLRCKSGAKAKCFEEMPETVALGAS